VSWTAPTRHASAGDLVQSMAKANRVDSAHIRAVLAHVEGRRRNLDTLLDPSVLRGCVGVDIREARTVEAFVSHLLGTGFYGLTFSLRPSPNRPFPSTSVLTDVVPGQVTELPEHDIPDVFADAALAIFDTARRSTSVFDGTTNEEFLVQLPDAADRWRAGVRMCFRDVAMQVAVVATFMGRPLSVVSAPVAGPAERGRPRGVAGPCLRVSVAFPQFDDSSRLRFGTKLIELCCTEGYGLWQHTRSAGDDRYDYWQPVVPLPVRAAAPATGTGAGGLESTPYTKSTVDRGLAVTCVGPARSGSTEAILRVLERAGAPLLGLSETTLDDIALIHLFTYTPLAEDAIAALPGDLPADALLNRALGMPPVSGSDSLRDYRAVISSRRERRPSTELAALWVRWAVPAATDALRVVVRTLRSALDGTGARYRPPGTPEPAEAHLAIGYLLCQEVSVDWMEGRVRIAADLAALGVDRDGDDGRGPDGVAALLGQFCSDVERQWRASLSFALGTPHVDVEVVWRESWLGRWVSLRSAHRDDLG
jgi:hypothetical protein